MNGAHSLYHRWINELWGGNPIGDEILSEDFVGHWPNREVRGRAELQAIINETRDMFESMTFEIEVGPLVDGDLVAARWRGVGKTTAGDVTFFGNDILRVADGKFAEYWTGTSSG